MMAAAAQQRVCKAGQFLGLGHIDAVFHFSRRVSSSKLHTCYE